MLERTVRALIVISVLLLATAAIAADDDDLRDLHMCGTAQHDAEVYEAGHGDSRRGEVVLAQRELASVKRQTPRDEVALGDAYYSLGVAYDGVNDIHADRAYAHALALPGYRRSDEWAWALQSYALRVLWRHDYSRAEELFRESLAFARAGRPKTTGGDLIAALEGLGDALVGLRRGREAAPVLDEGLALLRQKPKHTLGQELPLVRLRARAASLAGDDTLALSLIDDAVAKSATWGTHERIDVLLAAADIYRHAGRLDEARRLARQAAAARAPVTRRPVAK